MPVTKVTCEVCGKEYTGDYAKQALGRHRGLTTRRLWGGGVAEMPEPVKTPEVRDAEASVRLDGETQSAPAGTGLVHLELTRDEAEDLLASLGNDLALGGAWIMDSSLDTLRAMHTRVGLYLKVKEAAG